MEDGGRADSVRQGRSVAAVFPEEHEMVRGRQGREMGMQKGIAKCGLSSMQDRSRTTLRLRLQEEPVPKTHLKAWQLFQKLLSPFSLRSNLVTCAACPVAAGSHHHHVICDNCERGFYLACQRVASRVKNPSSIPNVSEAIASLSSTLEANSLREKHRCSFAPRLRRGQSSEPLLLTLEEVTPCTTFCRYAVVTGANKGIGFAICKQLALNGFTVVLTTRDEKRGVEAIEKLKELGLPSHVVFHQLDVIDPICSV
ncbi:hypothetical protein V8G54_012682 [Vigna mungo]|uniref:Uncharacterized protein n=1 Tax=Vigna mungo TaxID=3915 RepID=A0AAQ3NRM2_VIGMU